MTLVEMLEKTSKLFPDKSAIIYKDEKVTYCELRRQSDLLAGFLLGHGLKKGARVGLLLQKTPEAVISFLGVARAGGVVFPMDYSQPDGVVQHLIELTQPSFLIVDTRFKELLSRLNSGYLSTKVIFIGGKTTGEHLSWDDMLSGRAPAWQDFEVNGHDPVYLNFTSGSTGMPKGAITTHDNLYWNTRAVVERFGFVSDDVHLCSFPVFTHPHELFCRALYTGGTAVLTEDFLPKTVANAVSKHKVTCLAAISLLYENLVRYEVPSINFITLRIAEGCGMHVSSQLIESFKRSFNIDITPVWGSTETTGTALTNPVGSVPKEASIGKPCPYYEVKIVDEAGKEVSTGEIGEMIIRGAANCTGYFGNRTESAKLIRDGWLYTGDMVKTDADGFFYFITRKSRMMKVAGLKVYPSEIEEVLLKHPNVAEVAVTGVQDKILGEVPKAVVIPNANAKQITPGELRRYCAQNMAAYKVPAVIEFLSELPKAENGKVLYQKL